MEPRFDTAEVFAVDDYLYFYEALITEERTEAEVETIWNVLELERGMELLDLACGHGRIANRLAERGVRVTGLDASPGFLEIARRDAAERGVEVEYVAGDMRSLPWADRFDRIVNWFTSFGYFGDDENRLVLAEAHRALRAGGKLVIDIHNRDAFTRIFRPADVFERDGDLMIDNRSVDVLTGRVETERFVVRAGAVRRMHFSVRMFAFTELRDWLLQVGFQDVEARDHDGGSLTFESRRMLPVAVKG